MKFTLFKLDVKNNLVIWVIFIYVMCMYLVLIAYMYDPSESTKMSEIMDMLPAGWSAGFGFDNISTDLTGFIVDFYYGYLVFALPMVYCIIVSNRLVAKMVDNGSFVYLLMSPTSRKSIIFTKGLFMLSSIGCMFLVLYFVGVFACQRFFGDLLNLEVFLRVNVSTAIMTMMVGMICFFYSCLFNESKNALMMSTAIPLGSLLLNMLGGVSEKAKILEDISFYSMLNTKDILEGASNTTTDFIMIVIIILLFGISIWIFEKKNLPI